MVSFLSCNEKITILTTEYENSNCGISQLRIAWAPKNSKPSANLNEYLKSTYFREDLFSRIEVFQKFREDLFLRIQSFTNFREDLFSRNRPYKVLKKMIDCVNYGD